MDGDYVWLNDYSRTFLERDYLRPGQTIDERVDELCNTAQRILTIPGFAARFKENLKKGWYSLSTPVWTNFGTSRGLPISCFGSHIEDDMASILTTVAEVGMMSKVGGGTSAYFGELRGRGAPIKNNGESTGPVHFMQLFDNLVGVVSQGKTRRGNFAAYLDIDHPDIMEFLGIRSEGNQLQDISFGVCVPDYWMAQMVGGDAEKRKVWARVLEARANTGFPYIIFTDTANKAKPEVYVNEGMDITHSNLCVEIMLPDNKDESFVCCLSSMNLLHYDAWKDTDAVELLTFFLDAVMTDFIDKSEDIPYLYRARRFAENHRALGLGVLGWHSYLQQNMIPFESLQAKFKNAEVFKHLQQKTNDASKKLAEMFGEPALLQGYGRRNTTLMAIAPTKSSSFILGQVSEGIEPHRANFYIKDAAKGKFSIQNQHLKKLLAEKGQDTDQVWQSIAQRSGSVQHLSFLSDHEKAVFKTFCEITPREIIIQAAQRQKFLDQSQSLNLMIHPSVPIKDVNALIIEAWRLGVKSLYYQISVNAAQEFARNILSCTSCEG